MTVEASGKRNGNIRTRRKSELCVVLGFCSLRPLLLFFLCLPPGGSGKKRCTALLWEGVFIAEPAF